MQKVCTNRPESYRSGEFLERVDGIEPPTSEGITLSVLPTELHAPLAPGQGIEPRNRHSVEASPTGYRAMWWQRGDLNRPFPHEGFTPGGVLPVGRRCLVNATERAVANSRMASSLSFGSWGVCRSPSVVQRTRLQTRRSGRAECNTQLGCRLNLVARLNFAHEAPQRKSPWEDSQVSFLRLRGRGLPLGDRQEGRRGLQSSG